PVPYPLPLHDALPIPLLGDRGPTESNPVAEGAEHPPGTAATDATPDDPKDPTDQESGDVPPLEDPVAPPPVAPPVAPPPAGDNRSEEHTSELQSRGHL